MLIGWFLLFTSNSPGTGSVAKNQSMFNNDMLMEDYASYYNNMWINKCKSLKDPIFQQK